MQGEGKVGLWLPLPFVDRKMGMANVLFYVILPDFVLLVFWTRFRQKNARQGLVLLEFRQMNLGQE